MPNLKNIIKMFTLLIIMFSMTGCNSNYMSLNDMAIVSSIIIDKKDDKYITHIEIYKEEKRSAYTLLHEEYKRLWGVYEAELAKGRNMPRISSWEYFTKTPKDKISIQKPESQH